MLVRSCVAHALRLSIHSCRTEPRAASVRPGPDATDHAGAPARRRGSAMNFGTAVVILVAAIVLAAGMVVGVLLRARRLAANGSAPSPPQPPSPDPALAAAQEDQRADLA